MASEQQGGQRQRSPSLSLTTSPSSSGYYDSDDELDLLRRQDQKEWEEGLEQLQILVSVVLIPVLGKWMGRRWSGWAYDRYLRLGLGKTFFLGERLAAYATAYVRHRS